MGETTEGAAGCEDFFNSLLGDCMIAATAMRLAASLATANKTDFRRFTSLKLASGA